ncbi:MAG TPA: amidase [Thermoleophilaceae bacterium]|nr:amidase [Thermoleophilaceae bacterium]
MPALRTIGATEAARLIAQGEASAEEVVLTCLEQIAEREPTVRAWAHLDPVVALAQARAADSSQRRSPLHGVPVGVKDIIDTHDMPTECGSPIHAGRRPAADAACVARLREAGAVILGKTMTTELAYFHPAETRNPLDPRRTPGGSSSGSAAAVADGMVPLALGSQTAGSTIRPASFCGIFGLKPTHGLIDLSGVKRLSGRLDTLGLFARSIHDLNLFLGVLTDDPRSVPGSAAGPPRIGFARTARWQLVEPDAQVALEAAASELADAGARIDELELPTELEELVDAQQTIMAVDVAANLADEYDSHGDRISAELTALIEQGRAITRSDHEAALLAAQRGAENLSNVFGGRDVLLTPAARGQAPVGLDATGDPVFCRAWTLLGTPAISVPGPLGGDGLPLGVQLIAPPGRDAELLAAARWVGQTLA